MPKTFAAHNQDSRLKANPKVLVTHFYHHTPLFSSPEIVPVFRHLISSTARSYNDRYYFQARFDATTLSLPDREQVRVQADKVGRLR